jgi:hypothetical protein
VTSLRDRFAAPAESERKSVSYRRRTVAATAFGVLALTATACTPSAPNSFAAPDQPTLGSWTQAAATYIARHPAPVRPGMVSGILFSFDTIGPEPPSTCPAASGCFQWAGTVVVRGGHAVKLSTGWSRHSCATLEPVGEDDYFSWSASRDKNGCPRSVVIIKRAAITARDIVGTTPLPGLS